MRKLALLICFALITPTVMAEILSCDTLKARVDAKLQAKGVPSYTLEVIPVEEASNPSDAASAVPAVKTRGKEVGSCDGGTKRIMYIKWN